ncbi:LptF/LptG family permease [Deinococcus roseus]|uniref:Permease n=1 Tax=Deinococcus roseus TaxID=392414 RepID=A0ABQ2D1D4_9DEIO|nr:LptF/LptG family permease [Deinococcus roseus]GGJ41301.1 permease [Deinococcus roseus]
MRRRIDEYVITEVLPLLMAGMLVVVLLLLIAVFVEVLGPILAKGANPLLVGKLIAFSIPEAVGRGLPIALLFAVLIAMTRLAADSEIKGALAGGISPGRLLSPVMVLSVVVALVSFVNVALFVPRSTERALQTQRDILLDNPRVLVKEGTVFKDALNRAIYIDEILPGNQLKGVQVIQLNVSESPRELISADRGLLESKTGTIVLYDGQRVTYRDAKPVTVANFKEARLPVQDLQATFTGGLKSVLVNLPLQELWARVKEARERGFPAFAENTALQRKFAEPAAAIAFGFFAVTLALYSFRSGTSVGLVWVLSLTFLYYATWSVFRVMGENGALPPVVAAWAPDALYVLAGLGLLVVTSRR